MNREHNEYDENDDDEIEVDAQLVYRKPAAKLRTVDGSIVMFHVDVYETETPYVMIFVLKINEHSMVRMDVHKPDLARELRLWLEGKIIRNPAVVLSQRIEGLMQRFVNHGTTPKQEDLIMWILSRSELLFGRHSKLNFGGLPKSEFDEFGSAINRFQKTVDAHSEFRNSQRSTSILGRSQSTATFKDTINTILNEQNSPPRANSSMTHLSSSISPNATTKTTKTATRRPGSATQPLSTAAGSRRKPAADAVDKNNVADVATLALMSKLLGSKTAAMDQLKKAHIHGGGGYGQGSIRRPTPYDAEIERRKTLRAAQLSACKLLHKQKDPAAPARTTQRSASPARAAHSRGRPTSPAPPAYAVKAVRNARPPSYRSTGGRRFTDDGREVFDDDGYDSVSAPPPFDPSDFVGAMSEYGDEEEGIGRGRGRGRGYEETTRQSRMASPAQHNRSRSPGNRHSHSQRRQQVAPRPAATSSGSRITSYGQFEDDFTSTDAAWATEVLMRQSRLEQRLGRSYF